MRKSRADAFAERIAHLRGEMSWPFSKIAKEIGLHDWIVSRYCKANGIVPKVRPPSAKDHADKIALLRGERGLSIPAVGRICGLSAGAVGWFCLINGIEPPKPANRSVRIRNMTPMLRLGRNGRHAVRPFTPEDDAELLRLEAEGKSYMEIGRALNRRHNSIKGRLATLARRDARMEASAESIGASS